MFPFFYFTSFKTAQQLRTLLTQLGIAWQYFDHTHSSLYHPATNGLAESAIYIFKERMNKIKGMVSDTTASFLFYYAIIPHRTMDMSSDEMMFARRL